jgi:hypothetical protein
MHLIDDCLCDDFAFACMMDRRATLIAFKLASLIWAEIYRTRHRGVSFISVSANSTFFLGQSRHGIITCVSGLQPAAGSRASLPVTGKVTMRPFFIIALVTAVMLNYARRDPVLPPSHSPPRFSHGHTVTFFGGHPPHCM